MPNEKKKQFLKLYFALVIILCIEEKDEVNFLRQAQRIGMTKPNYVYFTLKHIPPDNYETPWQPSTDTEVIEAYKAVLMVGFLKSIKQMSQ